MGRIIKSQHNKNIKFKGHHTNLNFKTFKYTD